ncbi:hypothetical protein PILCRDRAFT_575686 [Piloderma croceum F 1598]|uniref:Uncharacterized protein n=1 Tax=Piloderma croceum (strain F 1598) TaxID=765440 RepID=A0A0C3F2P4_PILCF|nr:hypothetical protein PILCRDRAFT_575686 [Piloderma croceum F 1598]
MRSERNTHTQLHFSDDEIGSTFTVTNGGRAFLRGLRTYQSKLNEKGELKQDEAVRLSLKSFTILALSADRKSIVIVSGTNIHYNILQKPTQFEVSTVVWQSIDQNISSPISEGNLPRNRGLPKHVCEHISEAPTPR